MAVRGRIDCSLGVSGPRANGERKCSWPLQEGFLDWLLLDPRKRHIKPTATHLEGFSDVKTAAATAALRLNFELMPGIWAGSLGGAALNLKHGLWKVFFDALRFET